MNESINMPVATGTYCRPGKVDVEEDGNYILGIHPTASNAVPFISIFLYHEKTVVLRARSETDSYTGNWESFRKKESELGLERCAPQLRVTVAEGFEVYSAFYCPGRLVKDSNGKLTVL